VVDEVEDQGGLFAAVEGATRPVYSAGPKGGKHNLVMFRCPKSAISQDVWELLILWWNCRLMRCLPHMGGFLDQPKTVRDSFPVFEIQYQAVEQAMGQSGAMQAATTAVVGLMAAMGKR
jgi:hypothetical protein